MASEGVASEEVVKLQSCKKLCFNEEIHTEHSHEAKQNYLGIIYKYTVFRPAYY